MGLCPYADRQCTPECIAYKADSELKCMVLHRADRATMLLNFIEKKLDKLLQNNNQ